MSTTPTTIPFTSIIFGDRVRSHYDNIDLLAESIATVGLQCPIILSPLPDGTYLLEDGGRRYRAMESLGVESLWHGATSAVGRPGFVLKSEVSTPEGSKLTELIANLHRENLDWRDETKCLVQAWRLRKREADLKGEALYYATFGKMVGNYSYCDINAAVQIYDELCNNPEKFENCVSLHNAYQTMLKETQRVVEKLMATPAAPKPLGARTLDDVLTEANIAYEDDAPPSFPLTSRFRLGNSLDWMAEKRPTYDHIICDPDFAVDVSRLEASVADASSGVVQHNIESSLHDLDRLIRLAAAAVRSYFIFFYDLDHHEKLQRMCVAAGFAVQRWPILWHKSDYRSNAAPQHNFTKNMEYAMVCRKPSATLSVPAPSGVITLPSGDATRLGHPFAKPIDLWSRIYSAVCRPGDVVFDPFMGCGSSVLAALRCGMVPSGMELQEQHYHRALLNIKEEILRTAPTTMFS